MNRPERNLRAVRRLAGILLILAAVSGLPARAEPPPAEPEGQATDPGLQFVQLEIRDSFASGDPERLAGTLPRHAKTYVSCRPIEVGDGYYGSDQMRLFFRRMFRQQQTVRFVITEPALAPRADGRAVVVAEWLYQDAAGTPRESRLALTLAREGQDWRVREIRDLK
jgi:hypothetical protein